MKPLFLIAIFFIAANTTGKKQLAGMYYSADGNKYIGISIQLNSDSSFIETLSTCLSKIQADGRWHYNNDTVYLTSRYIDSALHIDVEEQVTGTNYTTVQFKNGWPKSTANYMDFKFGDSSFGWLLYGEHYPIINNRKGLKSFSVGFGSFYITYDVKNPAADNFIIAVDTTARFDEYLFLNDEKLLVRGKYLYPLNERNQVDSTAPDESNINHRIVYRLTKE